MTPLAGYLAGKYAGLNIACGLLVGLSAIFPVLVWRMRGRGAWPHRERLLAIVAIGMWVTFVFFSLADVQVGSKL